MAVPDTAIAIKEGARVKRGHDEDVNLQGSTALAAFRFLMRGNEPQPFGFPNGVNRQGQAGKMAQLAAGQANIPQLEIIEAMEFEELFPAAPIADELAQG